MLAAFEEMNSRGIHFTMADLARQLAVSKSTLYLYFTSKDELIDAITNAVFDDIRQQEEAISNDPNLSSLEKIESMLAVFPRTFGPIDNRLIDDFRRYMPKEQAKAELFLYERWQRLESLIHREIEGGRLSPINLAVMQKIYLLVRTGLVDYKFLAQNNLSAREAIAAFADILTAGLTKREKP